MKRFRVPGDKSITQRALILSALAEGDSRVSGALPGEDPLATAEVLRALGATIPELPTDGSEIRIRGRGLRGLQPAESALDCGNSGTCARLMLGVLSAQEFDSVLTGDASLCGRPMARVTDPLGRMGAHFEYLEAQDRLPVRVRGGALRPLEHASAVASAQVKSALLLAGVVGGVSVRVTEPETSRDHTERMLSAMGCPVESHGTDGGWTVRLAGSSGPLAPLDLAVPGDFSSAAFLLVLGSLLAGGDGLLVEGVGVNPTRTGALPVLERMGASVEVRPSDRGTVAGEPVADLHVRPAPLEGVSIGAEMGIASLIDEVPVLVAAAVRARGETRITGARELRVKETDRVHALVSNLRAIGVEADELPDGLVLTGTTEPLRGRVRAWGDHRIAMAFGVLAALPGSDIEIDDPSVVAVSYPDFWETVARATGADTR